MAKRPLARGGSNVRPAPFELTPKAVRRLIDDRLPLPATVTVKLVPLLPIKLVDMPRGGEPVRQPGGDACSAEREVPFLTKVRSAAARQRALERALVKVCEVDSAPDLLTQSTQLRLPVHPIPHCAGQPSDIIEPAAAQVGRASRKGRDRANGSKEGNHAARPTESDAVEALTAPDREARPGFYSEGAGTARLLRAGRARSRAEAAEAAARRVTRAAEIAAAEDDLMSEFSAALARARARRDGLGGEIKRPLPQSDNARLAAAFARKAETRVKRVETAPLQPAPTRESCPRCGIPGWKGCDHFLPCEPERPAQ